MRITYEAPLLETLGSIAMITSRQGSSSLTDTGYFDGEELPGFGSRDTCEVDAETGEELNPLCPL